MIAIASDRGESLLASHETIVCRNLFRLSRSTSGRRCQGGEALKGCGVFARFEYPAEHDVLIWVMLRHPGPINGIGILV